jgi:SAM-dependent methyltransferase
MTGGPYRPKPWKGSSHDLALRCVGSLEPGSRVLDVGTAGGVLGRALSGRYHLVGIEPAPVSVDGAAPFYERIFVGTLDQAPDELIARFDLVVCCDVLEHMADPEVQLARLVAAQDPPARFLVSVPNIAHLWVRLNLLVGRFDYSERGILDRTHLRFFTRRSLVEMLERVGLSPIWIRPTPVPLELLHPLFQSTGPGRMICALQRASVAVLPRLLGYQHVCLAERRGARHG